MLVPEAPVFHPTPQEFEDPLAYISSIREHAEAYGICKVIPPAGWRPPFAIDRKSYRFRTRIQSVHELQQKADFTAASESFNRGFQAWLRSQGKAAKRNPVVAGQEVDLAKLYRLVSGRGGFERVNDDKLWRDIARIMQIDDKTGNAVYTLRQTYQKHLLPYETYCQQRMDPEAGEKGKGKAPATSNAPSRFDAMLAAADDAAEAAEILGSLMSFDRAGSAEDDGPPFKRLKTEDVNGRDADKMRVPANIYELNCELCKGGHHEDKIILCDQCDRGCHLFCLNPPLETVPEGHWVCPLCREAEAEGGAFKEGHEYSLLEFEQIANDFKAHYFGGQEVTWEAIEAAFWEIVEEGEESIDVIYGADLDSTQLGSGFPRAGGRLANNEYAEAMWNLNNFPRLQGRHGSMLRHVDDNIPGVMVPWVYMGMLFSSFAWHIEDHMFYSINYHHWGDAKRWYGIPSAAAALFEAAFKKALPEKFDMQPDLLFHLTAMLSPRVLRQHNVPVFGVLQEPGEFVVTFPGAYHGGFNTGLNCAEAVNFAPADWLRFAPLSLERYRSFRKPSLLSHEWLLLKVAREETSPDASFFVHRDLQRVIQEEREWRFKLWSQGCLRSRRVTQEVGMDEGDTDDAECVICHAYCHESAVECECCPRRRTCLRHAAALCECPPPRWRIAFRHSLAELQALLQEVSQRIPEDFAAEMEAKAALPVAAECPKCEEPPARSRSRSASEAPQPSVKPEPDQPPSAEPEARKQRKRKNLKERAPPLIRKTRAQLKLLEAEEDLMTVEDSRQGSPQPQLHADEQKDVAAGPASPHPEEALEAQAGTAAQASPVPEPQPPAEPEQDPMEEDADTMDALDAFSALADLADYAEREAGSQSPRVGFKAEAGPSGEANGHGEGTAAPGSVAAASAGGQSQPSASTPPTKILVERWTEQLRDNHRAWVSRAKALLETGGAKVAELDALLAEAEQFAWGPEEVQADVAPLESRLKEAKAWVGQVTALLKNKGSMKQLEPVVAWDPAPVYVSGYTKLREGYTAAQGWVAKAAEVLASEGPCHLKTLESLVSEASRIPVSLPDAKVLRERVAAGRKLVEAISTALPVMPQPAETPVGHRARRARSEYGSHRKSGSVEKDAGNEPVTLERLKQLQIQAAHTQILVPELDALNNAVTKLAAFQARCKELQKVVPTLAELEELDAEAQELPGVVLDMDNLSRLLVKARDWLAWAASAAKQRAPLKRMREVLHAGLRLGVEVPQVDELRLEIRRREWEELAKKALSAKQSLAALQELLAEAAAKGADETSLADGLRKRIASAEDWERRADAFFASPNKHVLQALEDLAEDGNSMGVKMGSLVQVNTALTSAHGWAKAAAAASAPSTANAPYSRRPHLAQVEKLLAAYEDMMVELSEAAQLKARHEQAQAWVAEAQEHLSIAEKPIQEHFPILEGLVEKGLEVGLVMPELNAARDRLAALHWNARARTLLAATESLPAQLLPPPSTPVAVSHAPTSAPALATPAQPAPAAAQCPVAGPDTAALLPPPQPLAAAAEEPGSVQSDQGLAGSASAMKVEQPAAAPMSQPADPSAEPGTSASGEVVLAEALVAQPPSATDGALADAEQPNSSGRIAEEVQRPPPATPVREAGASPVNHAGLEGVAGSAIFTKVSPMKLGPSGKVTIEDLMAGLEETSSGPQADGLTQLAPAAGSGPWTKALLGDGDEEADAAMLDAIAPRPTSADLASAPQPSTAAPQQQNLNGQLRTPASKAAERFLADEKAAAEEEASEAARRRGDQPTLAQAAALAAEAEDLPVDAELKTRLDEIVHAGEDWEARCAAVLNPKQAGPGDGVESSMGEVAALLEEGKALGLQLKGLPKLISAMAAARAWNVRAARALRPGAEKPSYADMAALADGAAEVPIVSPLSGAVLDAVAAAEGWQERARRAMAKRNSGQKLSKCLTWLASSIERALEQLTMRVADEKRLYWQNQQSTAQPQKRAATPSTPTPETAPSDGRRRRTAKALQQEEGSPEEEVYVENEHELFCVCQQPYNIDTAMIECDLCNEWYHLKCMGLTQGAAKQLKRYSCPLCMALKNQPHDLDAAISRTRRTRRPDRGTLAQLVQEAAALPCTMPEQVTMMHILSSYDRWQTAVDLAVRAHEQSSLLPDSHTPGTLPADTKPQGRLRVSMLSQLAKSGLSLEVDCGELGGRVLTALRAERWRTAAEHALRSPSKTTTDMLCKLVKEAEGFGLVLTRDLIGSALGYRAAAAKAWLERCRTVVADLNNPANDQAALDSALKRAEAIAQDADLLSCNVSKDLERLKEATKLWCLCKLPYNEDRPMLACDYCQDWFHYDCVGLRPPGDEEDDEDVAPPDFRCPSCCLKEGKAYPEMARMPERSILTLQAEFCSSTPISNGVASLGPAAQLPVPDISLASGNGAPAVPSTNGLSASGLSSSLPQVLAGLQYSLPAPDMGGLTQQQTQWVLAALAAQGQQQLLPSVSAALALSHNNPAAAAGLFSHFPNSQLQGNLSAMAAQPSLALQMNPQVAAQLASQMSGQLAMQLQHNAEMQQRSSSQALSNPRATAPPVEQPAMAAPAQPSAPAAQPSGPAQPSAPDQPSAPAAQPSAGSDQPNRQPSGQPSAQPSMQAGQHITENGHANGHNELADPALPPEGGPPQPEQEPKAEKGPASFTEDGSAGSDNAAAAGAAQPLAAAVQ
ncbi:g1411 [Coccomyxa elongata]